MRLFSHRLLLAALASCGLFFGTANPILHVPFAILLYPLALCALSRGKSPFRAGWMAGIPGAACALYWVACAAHHYGDFPWLLAAPCSILLGMYVSLWGGLFSWLASRFSSLPLWRRALACGALWTILEWTRGWFGTGFPWLTLSSGLAAWPVLCQPLCLAGAYGYSGYLAAAAVFAEESMHLFLHEKHGATALAIGVSLCIATALFGTGRLKWQNFAGEPLTVALIQGNVRQDVKWTPEHQSASLEKYMRLSRKAIRECHAAKKSPDLLLWPETAMPFYYPASPHLQELRDFSISLGMPLITGIPALKYSPDGSRMLLNRACLFDGQQGEIFYDKEHLVPFGEYVPPFLDLPLFQPLLQGLGGFSTGENHSLFALHPAGRKEIPAGMLICYEAVFPELARARVADGAQLLFNISNDAWYDRTSAAMQHAQLSLMRAVEQGRWIARATNTGITAMLDPFGRMHALGTAENDHALFTENHMIGTALALRGHTPYFYLHPWLPWLAFLLLCGASLPAWRKKYQHD